MSLSGFWRRMRGYGQPRDELTIDLAADDQMDLSMAIIGLDDQQLSALGWTPDRRREVFDALNAHALDNFNRGVVVGSRNEPIPVRLPEEDWKRIFALALIAKDQFPHSWPIRVIGRIAAEGLKPPRLGQPPAQR